MQQVLGDSDTSPVPKGWTVGGIVYSGSSTYSAGQIETLPVPGGIYLGDDFMYLGDRAFYTFAKQGPLSFFGRVRLRLGNLDPADSPEWTGLQPRKWQLEAGLGSVLVSPVGLWTARFSSDVSGRSKGTEVLLNWSAPIVGERWLLMPGAGVFWRSGKLANYYFGGVSAAEAAPGRPAYDVGAVWSFTPQVIASYRLSPQWVAGLVLSAEVFADAVSNSPLVQKKARYDALIGMGYVWR
jgi:outer membrane protein